MVSHVAAAEPRERSFYSGRGPPAVYPGDLVRLADGPPELLYCWPRGEWHLWIDELTARHGGRVAVVLEQSETVDSDRNVVDVIFPAAIDLVVDYEWEPKCRARVRVMFDDGWVGYVWLTALRVLESQESQESQEGQSSQKARNVQSGATCGTI